MAHRPCRPSTRSDPDYLSLVRMLRPIVEQYGAGDCVTPGGHAHPDFVGQVVDAIREDRASSTDPRQWRLPYRGAVRRRWIEDAVVCIVAEGTTMHQEQS
jgi:hypothetical protein